MNAKEAKAAGLVHFNGSPCGTCGNIRRYTSTSGCVQCKKKGKTTLAQISAEKQQEQVLRDAAVKLGEPRYQGRDCLHAHGGLRYSTTGACVGCRRNSELASTKRKRDEREAQKQRRKAPPIVRPNPTPDMDGFVSCITPPTLAMLMGRRAP